MSTPDPVQQVRRARVLARAREAALAVGGTGPDDAVRRVVPRIVTESWERSLAAHIDPERGGPPLDLEHDALSEVRREHPLAQVLPLLRDTLVSIADQAMHMMIVTDAQGRILWREGARGVLSRAERVGLVEGTRWSEDAIGTNAMGTALAADRAVQIHSAEHLVRTYHSWTCAAAPVHDPENGTLLGAVDVTGPVRTFHPTTLALVTAAARLAEGHLRTRLAFRDERLLARNLPHLARLRDAPGALLTPGGRVLAAQPPGWVGTQVTLPDGGDRILLGGDLGEAILEPLAEGWLLRPARERLRRRPELSLALLLAPGTSRPSVHVDGTVVRLTPRHAELLALLALHPAGLSAEEVAAALHGDTGRTVTVRAEMHRLRACLPAGVVRTQPYRLDAQVEADFLAVRSALAHGHVRDAATAYRGPLLPRSDAPALVDERELLAAAVRAAVLRSGDTDALRSLIAATEHPDAELTDRLVTALPPRDPRRSALPTRRA